MSRFKSPEYPKRSFQIALLDAFEHLMTQAHQFDLDRLHEFATGVGEAQTFGAAILGIFGAADVAGMAQLIEQTHQRWTLHPGGLRHLHLAHALAQTPDHQERHGAGFGDSIVDQRGLADLPPMPGGHHHGTADVHLESVEIVRHEEMHTVSLLTINIALEGNFSQVLKQIACLPVGIGAESLFSAFLHSRKHCCARAYRLRQPKQQRAHRSPDKPSDNREP